MTITPEELKKQLASRFPDAKLRLIANSLLVENPQDLTRIAFFLKEAPELRMDYLSSVTAADHLSFLESIYHFYSVEKKTGPVVLRVRVARDHAKIPSLVPVYRGAEYQEREAYDTFGIIYEGHPDLRRLFMWEGFEGFPLRKDFIQEDADVLEQQDIAWLEARGVTVAQKFREKAKELGSAGKKAVSEKPVQPRT